MKIWVSMLVILISVVGLCVWDGVHTQQVFSYMESESNAIYQNLLTEDVTSTELKSKIENLNNFWTKEMDVLCISISRKDLQVVSDYLQYLYTSTINESQEDAITYSRLLNYNITGLKQSNGMQMLNLL